MHQFGDERRILELRPAGGFHVTDCGLGLKALGDDLGPDQGRRCDRLECLMDCLRERATVYGF